MLGIAQVAHCVLMATIYLLQKQKRLGGGKTSDKT